VSSSGHLALLPRLCGWPYAGLEPELRKSVEIALHAGSAAALVLLLRRELAGIARDPGTLLALAPPAALGLALERPIERRLGGVRAVAAAQVVAGVALYAADRRPALRRSPRAADALAVGAGQAIALVPGVSRAGAALTAARLRGLDRPAAFRLSLRAALPVTLAATALKAARAARRPPPAELRAPIAVGATAAFASTLASRGLLGRLERASGYGPIAAYRVALGGAVLARVVRSRP
jgi:undecaprenyl-diphosphatase